MTLSGRYRAMAARLSEKGVEAPSFAARQLLSALGLDPRLEPGRVLTPDEQTRLTVMLDRLERGEPLQYILGCWEFYSIPLQVGPGVLIPRQDTECLVDFALRCAAGLRSPVIADLCSGSGCIALAVALNLPGAQLFAVEWDPAAYRYLQRNIADHTAQIHPLRLDVTDPRTPEQLPLCDLILSNPPYLTEAEMTALPASVEYEPAIALNGGRDGLSFYRAIVQNYAVRLKPGGTLAFEVGYAQAGLVTELLERFGYQDCCTLEDLNGIRRVVSGRWPG